MSEHIRKLSQISLSQGKIFPFYSELGHFQLLVVTKNILIDFSKKGSYDFQDIKVLKKE